MRTLSAVAETPPSQAPDLCFRDRLALGNEVEEPFARGKARPFWVRVLKATVFQVSA